MATPRLKGTVVTAGYGKPYLSATQIFDVRPISRRFLSVEKITNPELLEAIHGQILVTRSGNVGRSTLAHSVHAHHVISDDLLRVDTTDPLWWGWIYAYLRAPTVREMMKAAQYGHIIKHLEVSHLEALPVVDIPEVARERFSCLAQNIIEKRDAAYQLTLRAEQLFQEAFGPLDSNDFGEGGFIEQASRIFGSSRRRLDAWHYNPSVQQIISHLSQKATDWTTIGDAGFKVWLAARFRRVPAPDGIPFLDSSDLFEINPDITKKIADADFGDLFAGRVKRDWLLLSRSGQIYGLNGSAMISGHIHEDKIVSDHVIRVAPEDANCPLGYALTAITHPTLGRPRIKALPYGSSIPEIEVRDVERFAIPRLAPALEGRIADCAEEAAHLRDESDQLENALGDEAETVVARFLAGCSLAML